jgi:hypothetical protein
MGKSKALEADFVSAANSTENNQKKRKKKKGVGEQVQEKEVW